MVLTRTAAFSLSAKLPGEVGERLVGVGHAVHVFALGEGHAFLVVRGDEFIGQLQVHRAALLLAASEEQPTNRQRLLPVAIDLHRHLVSSTTDAAAANFDVRLHVFDGRVKDFDRLAIRNLFLNVIKGRIEENLRDALLAAEHQAVNELAGQDRLVARIRLQRGRTGSNLAHTKSESESGE